MKETNKRVTFECDRDPQDTDLYHCRIKRPLGKTDKHGTFAQESVSEDLDTASETPSREPSSAKNAAGGHEDERLTLRRILKDGKEVFERVEPLINSNTREDTRRPKATTPHDSVRAPEHSSECGCNRLTTRERESYNILNPRARAPNNTSGDDIPSSLPSESPDGDRSVGRTRLSRLERGGKQSCPVRGRQFSSDVENNDRALEGS